MHHLRCSEIWGGIRNQDLEVCSSGLTASLYSGAAAGGKGGDIYYLSVCENDWLTRVAVADVLGHGEHVSAMSKWLYEALRTRITNLDGHEVLAELNRLAAQRGFDAMTTAAIVGVFKRDGHGYFAYAGHHPVMIRRRSGSDWRNITIDEKTEAIENLPLGVEPSATYSQRKIRVESGDRLVLYTDGVIEAFNGSGELFGFHRLEAILERVGEKPLPELKSAVLDELRHHTGGTLDHDDVTFLAMEVL